MGKVSFQGMGIGIAYFGMYAGNGVDEGGALRIKRGSNFVTYIGSDCAAFGGNSPSGYTNKGAQSQYSAGDVGTPDGPRQPYHGQSGLINGKEDPKYPSTTVNPNQPGMGAVTADDNSRFTQATNPWPLKNYTKAEIANGNSNWFMNAATCRALDAVASETGKRKIKSSYRSSSRNSSVGGASRSQHMVGRAGLS